MKAKMSGFFGLTERADVKFIAACCRWPRSTSRNEMIGTAANDIDDWDEVRREALRQQVAALVRDGLRIADCAPPAIIEELEKAARYQALNNLAQVTDGIGLQEMFDAAGIRSLHLKGVSLGMLAYGSLDIKHSLDLDFQVDPGAAEEALRLMGAEGYRVAGHTHALDRSQRRAVIRHHKAVTLFKDNRPQVDLHWRLCSAPDLLRGIDISSEAQAVTLAPRKTLRTFSDENLFAYICVHGALHGWARLKWLADVNAYLTRLSPREIENCVERARSVGAGRCAAQAMLLCEELFGSRERTDFSRLFAGNRHLDDVRRSTRFVRRRIEEPYHVKSLPRRTMRMIRQALNRRLLFPKGGEPFAFTRALGYALPDQLSVPLPRRLDFLYPVLRLPLWIWRRLR